MKIKKRDCSPFVDKCVKKTQFSQEDMNKFHEYLKSFILTEEQLIANDYPIWDKVKINEIFYSSTGSINPRMTYAKEGDNERICSHCSKTFEINGRTLEPTKKDVICIYHSERLSFNFAKRDYDKAFSCCGGSSDSVGCKEANEHVTSTQPYSNLKLYKECPPCADDNTTKGVYALDCEMVLTTAGQDVARVTVVDMNSDVVFDQLIKPKYRITDYRTQFSGITEELLGTNAVSLEEAQQKLFKLVNQDTILIGHSLNCDLETLKIVHKNVVDTSVTFPHKNPKYKQSLKNIAKAYINMDIQEAHTGHDSAEDAIAAMKVLIAKYQGKI
uniref:Exonuclease domain-containing protein n=1 Tax=Parastrongyloides trichosuri TaxID=131310 RepID=A0A0N4Z3W3_PARTI